MNHYPHHIGDFVKDTLGFSQGAVGAYRLLMDAYYANEEAPAAEEVYIIGRATTGAERKNVDKALTKFELREGRYFHKRAEEELAAYYVRADSARENGKKGGRPKKPTDNPRGNPQETEHITETITHGEPSEKLASSHKPETQKRFPGVSNSSESAGVRGAAALAELKALSLAEAKIPGGPETPAAMLASVLLANGCKGNAFHPLVVEWARDGFTVEKLQAAIAKARQRPGKDKGTFGPEYLDPILHDESKPAAQVAVEKSAESGAKAHARTQKILAEQRAKERTEMPAHLRPKGAEGSC